MRLYEKKIKLGLQWKFMRPFKNTSSHTDAESYKSLSRLQGCWVYL